MRPLSFYASRRHTYKLEEYGARQEMSWIVDKGSEGIPPWRPVNWPSLRLFGSKALHSLMAVNVNEHLVCSALYLDWWGRHSAEFPHSYSACQNGNLTDAQPFFLLIPTTGCWMSFWFWQAFLWPASRNIPTAKNMALAVIILALYTHWKTSASQAEHSSLTSVL